MNFLRRLMAGRYGGDSLGWALLIGYLVCYLLGQVTHWGLFNLAGLILAVWCAWRMFSRNIPRRRAENERFLSFAAPIRRWLHTANMRRTDKVHKYFKCPRCGQQLRVPRGNGRIKVTCRSCGNVFEEES